MKSRTDIWADYEGRCGDCGYRKCQCRPLESVEYNRGPEHDTLLDRWLADPLNNQRPDAITDRRSVKK